MADTILNQSVDEVLKALKTDPSAGLSLGEVDRRLKQYGYNEIPEKRDHPLVQFLKKFWGITAWMLELIIVLSWILHRLFDLFVVTSLLIFNAIISFAEERMASNAIESLRKRLYVRVKVLREGKWSVIPARELVPGDSIGIKVGDFIPADIKIVAGSLEIDQSALTGESFPLEKKQSDLVYSGSIVRRGEASGVVVLTGSRTYFGKTVELVQRAAPKSHIEAVVASLTTWLLTIVALTVLVAFIVSLKQGLHPLEILPLMLVLLLAGIPVALPAMFTITMALGSRALSKKNALVTRLNAVEDAATMSVLCIDKTGTLTMNEITIADVIAFNGYSKENVVLYGALASQEASLDPIDLAFISAAKQENLSATSFTVRKFIPFEPATKRTEALIEKDGESFHIYKGALEPMVKSFGLTGDRAALESYAHTFAEKGFRTIAVARTVNTKVEMIGLVALKDPPRPESKQVLGELKKLGIAIKLLTGDALPIAKEIAQEVDLTGNAVDFSLYKSAIAKNPDLLIKSAIFAEIYPEDKYEIVKLLQGKEFIVGMTGDGVNDAPALQQAEVGIAVSNATDVAKKAASVVLMKPGLYLIKELITIGRLVFQRVSTWILNKISRTILKVGFIVIVFLVTGYYVISSAEMLLLIFMTDFVKLSLSTDNERISRKPSAWNVASLTRLASILGVAMVLEALGLLYFGIHYLALTKAELGTFSFAILFYFAIFSLFVVREKGHFWESMPSKVMLIAILIDAILAFMITTAGLLEFKALPIPYVVLVILYAFIFSLVINDWIKLAFQPEEQA